METSEFQVPTLTEVGSIAGLTLQNGDDKTKIDHTYDTTDPDGHPITVIEYSPTPTS